MSGHAQNTDPRAQVWPLALDVWKTEADAREFLQRRHPMLGGHRPYDVALGSEEGARSVLEILGRLKHGVAA